VECTKALLALLSACPGVDRLVAQGDELTEFDTHAPLLSLPRILQTSLETIPAAVPYLSAAPALVESWREKLRGRPGHGPWRARNISLQQFAALAAIPGVRLVSLQRGAAREEIAQVREHFIPVWVALPFAPDWRWLLDRADSPWYPTMRLFRQRERGNWHSVFEEIEAALRGRLQSSSS
jgi:hypothetical protein